MYYIVFSIGVLLSVMNDKRKISLIIFGFVLAIFAFLRYGIGVDYFAYEYLYSRLSDSIINEFKYGLDSQELLFRVFGSFLKSIGLSYQMYVVVIAAINLFFLCKICIKYSRNPTLSLLLYFCFYYLVWTFSGLRQGLTIAIGVYYLLQCIQNRKTIKFTLIVFFLTFVHASSIILLPLYFFSRINLGKRTLIYLSFFCIAFSFIPLAKTFTHFTWIPFMSRVLPYLGSDGSLIQLNFQSIGRIVFLILALIYYDGYAKKDDLSKKIINIYVISLLVYFIFKFSELTAARLSIYGRLLEIIILPNIYYLYREKINRIIYASILFVIMNIYFYKELGALIEQTQIKSSNKILTPYIHIYNKDEYTFNNMYYDLLNPNNTNIKRY